MPPSPSPAALHPPAPPRRRPRAPLLILLLVLAGAWPMWRLLGPRGVPVEIAARTWRLEVDVERRVLESASDWCDALPEGAIVQERRLLADPAGQRAAPALRCRYQAPAWRLLYRASGSGDIGQPETWPQTRLTGLPGLSDADVRLGKRRAFYELRLQADDGRDWTCALPRPAWQAQAPGRRFRLPVDRFGTADCSAVPSP